MIMDTLVSEMLFLKSFFALPLEDCKHLFQGIFAATQELVRVSHGSLARACDSCAFLERDQDEDGGQVRRWDRDVALHSDQSGA